MRVSASLKAMVLAGSALLGVAYASPRSSIASVAAVSSAPRPAQRDSGSVRELVDGIRGANAVQCELILQAFVGWTSNVPDRDANAWRITQRLRQRVVAPGDIAWLGEQLRGADGCAARASARLLGRSPSPTARTLLTSALTDGRPEVRRLAAVGIGVGSDSTMNRRLVNLLKDSDAGVRAAAAWALGAVH